MTPSSRAQSTEGRISVPEMKHFVSSSKPADCFAERSHGGQEAQRAVWVVVGPGVCRAKQAGRLLQGGVGVLCFQGSQHPGQYL